MDQVLRSIIHALELEWGCRPFVVLACQGGADEHWQIFHADDELTEDGLMPRYVIGLDGKVEVHP